MLNDIKIIEAHLMSVEPELVCLALTNEEKRQELKKIIKTKFPNVATDDETAEKITSEIVGTGIIEEIISKHLDVTDIKYDADQLTVAGITSFTIVDDERINEVYVQRLIQKFATALGVDFSTKNPIIDGVLGNLRINAVHNANTTGGTTFSIRVVRPVLALNDQNFKDFAPEFIFAMLKAKIDLYCNILIAGRTGTGKTEVQKLGISFTKGKKEEIGVIQDVPELFSKILNPGKSIYEWLTGNGKDHNDLITAAMRNNFRWIIVSEVINKAAYGLWQALTSGHAVLTTLHAKNALAIPKRAAQLAKFAPEAATMDIEMLKEDFEDLVDFGWYIEKETLNGRDYRYLSEIAAYSPKASYLMFKQHIENDCLHWQTFTLPEEFKLKLKRKGITIDFPENSTGVIPLHSELREVSV